MNIIRIFIRIAILFVVSLGAFVIISPLVDKPLTKLIDRVADLLRRKEK